MQEAEEEEDKQGIRKSPQNGSNVFSLHREMLYLLQREEGFGLDLL